MRIIKLLILLLVIFISCEKEKEEPLPRLNGSYNGYVTEYHCPSENFISQPCEWTPLKGSFSADGECSLTFEDDRYHLQIKALLEHFNSLYGKYGGELIWSKEINIEEKGTFKYNIQLGPEKGSCFHIYFGYRTCKLPKHYTGHIVFYPEDQEKYGASLNTLKGLYINYLTDIEDSMKFCTEWNLLYECIKDTIRTEYKIRLSFDSDCWNSFLEY